MERDKNLVLAFDHLKISKDKLEAAKILFNNGKFSEAIGRAYYSVFHSLKSLLVLSGVDAKTHRGVFYSFYKEFVEKDIFPRDIYREISQLQHKREDADYGVIVDVFSSRDAQDSLSLAEFVYSFAEKLITMNHARGGD